MTSYVTQPTHEVAIIGAGLAGLSLALALHDRKISCTIYELRSPDVKSYGALMLGPNALKVLNSIGVYERIRTKGYNFVKMAFKNEAEETTDIYPFGNDEEYGVKALRIYRQVLLTELRAMVHERGIHVTYGKKFAHVVEETESTVRFTFTDGSSASAGLLIGADGIHSTVRKYITPDTKPAYSGMLAVTCAIPTSALRFPTGKDYSIMPVGIYASNGTFILAPQNVDGSEMLAGTQMRYAEQTREEWDRLSNDKQGLYDLLSANKATWPYLVHSALDAVPLNTLSIWPYYTVPKLSDWTSSARHSRVLILGDAAHAIPPTAGQGASQAFEDAISLALILEHVRSLSNDSHDLAGSLRRWQSYRQERIDRVIKLTLKLNNTRLPQAERNALEKYMIWTSSSSDLAEIEWLYNHDIEKAVLENLQ